jgi:protein disulfide-isomerase
MKKFAVGLLACCTLWYGTIAAEPAWLTNLEAAQARAKAEQKLVLVDFTGSDWCPPCIELDKRVFTKPAFLDYAKSNLVLVQLDFPQTKPQPVELKNANQALAQKFQIEGFPTLIVFDSNGKELKRETGYAGRDADSFIKELKQLQANSKSK